MDSSSKDIASSGATFLCSLLDREGRFKYRYNLETAVVHKGYNVLRHAGTIWSMLDVYSLTEDRKILSRARNAATYLLNNYLKFYKKYTNACICEDNKIKLGGNALAIIALTSLYRITGETFLLSLSEQLGRFMIDTREPDGDLIHKRYFRSGKISSFRSMYYTGEALLALLMLHDITNDSKWLDVVVEIEQMLAPRSYGVPEQSHWMLYALQQLSEIDNGRLYYDHAVKIAEHILDHPDYLTWDRSTPIACRSEGLIAFLGMKRPDGVNDSDLRDRCLRQIRDNLEYQKKFLQADGSFVRGGSDGRRMEVRIDYIQHNISSFLHFYRMEDVDRSEPESGD